jgi:pilus assembly protein CpaE
VIVIHSSAEPAAILGAVRAGADEYVYPPLKDDLTNALKRMSTERAKRRAGTRPRGKVFGFLSAKGGCGATTIACHLAAELHRQTDMLVLLADFDIDVGVVGFLMKSQNRYSVLDAVANVHRLDLSFWKALVSNGVPGVEVISAPSSSASRKDGKLEEFADVLRFVRSNYDWTMVDIGRGLTALAMNVLEELDQLFLVTTVDIPALHQAKQIVRTLHDTGYGSHRLNLLLNCLPKRTDISVSELERMLGTPVYETIANDHASLHDAYAEGVLLPPNSKLGKQYSRLAVRMAGIQQPRKKRGFLGL